MSKKNNKIFVCSKCGAQSLKWSGRCLECESWGSLEEKILGDEGRELEVESAHLINLSELNFSEGKRLKTNISELDRVLGGGFIPGSLLLFSGDPGIGKSTMLAQIAETISNQEKKVYYLSGEESASQVKNRLERLNCDFKKIGFLNENDVEKVAQRLREDRPDLVIIDSIQTVYSSLFPGEAGSLNQIRASTVKFLELAKKYNIIICLVGHITKDGQIAGPKTLEHIVDTVIYLENSKQGDYRVLRAVKNRFGSINEIGIFEMTGNGFKEIKNPSSVFLEEEIGNQTGSVISCIMEGTRPFLLEIQALVTKTFFGYPQRKTSGYDLNRLQVLSSVLTKKGGINLSNQDVIINVVGGIKINDTGLDLALCLSIISSILNIKINRKLIVLGELGLGGEIRSVSKIKERLLEAEKLGFKEAIIPNIKINSKKLKLIKVRNLEDLLKEIKKGTELL